MYIILLLLIAVLVYFIISYNKCITLLNYVKEAFSTMDVYMKKRWDLIPNLLETVKGYMQYEQETIKEITYLRNVNYDSMSPEEKIDANSSLGLGLTKLLAVAENYPDLKASEIFSKLQSKLSNIEDDIANSRKYYNGCVREYNTTIQLFPTNIVANTFNFKEQKLYEIEEAQRENVKVSF